MAIMPGVIFKEVKRFRTPMLEYNRVNLHIAVSEAASLFGYFNGAGRPCSHFYVRRDGTIEQYVDTRYRAAADYQGNDATISVETQGGAEGNWTPQQVAANAAIFLWAMRTHGIRQKIVSDSRIGESSRGLSYHRFGVDPWRVSGGMRYSTARGKICPTDARIAQVPEIFNLATGGGALIPTPAPTPAPAPAPGGGGASGRNPRPVGAAIQKGDTGPGVAEVQRILANLGFYSGDVDHSAGPATDEAIRSFQFAAFGPGGVDGSFGPGSRAAAAKVPAFPGYSLQGTSGADTGAFQRRLKERGYSLDADNSHGPTTTKRLKAFQSEKGLSADGNGGPQTWTALYVRPVT